MACGRQQRASSIRSALQHRSLRCNSGWASSLTLAASTWAGRTRGHCAASVSGGAAHRLWGCTALRAPSRPGSQAQLGSPEGHRRARARPRGGVVCYLPLSGAWRPRGGLGGQPCARAASHAPCQQAHYTDYLLLLLVLLLVPATGPLGQSSGPRSAGLLRVRVRVRVRVRARARARALASASARARARPRVGASLREAEARSRLLAHSVRPGLGQG